MEDGLTQAVGQMDALLAEEAAVRARTLLRPLSDFTILETGMSHATTAEIINRFNHAFVDHDAAALDDLIGEDCVMEAIQPAPDGARYQGREACLGFWRALAEDLTTQFEAEEIVVAGDRATIRWRYRFGEGPADSVRGVNLMRVRDGLIVEALGYSKTGGEIPLAADEAARTAGLPVD